MFKLLFLFYLEKDIPSFEFDLTLVEYIIMSADSSNNKYGL